MTTQQAYDKYLIKLNDNFETSKISSDKGRFVINFNESQNKLTEYIYEKKNEDDIRYIQKLLVPNKELDLHNIEEEFTSFKLPDNFFDHVDLKAIVKKDKCKGIKIDLFEIKAENSTLILQDEDNKPTFLFREAPYHLAEDSVVIYKEDFEYQKAFLKYYRYPQQISLQDPLDPESDFSDVNPEFDDKFVDRIISLAVSDAEANSESQKFQIDKLRAQSKI